MPDSSSDGAHIVLLLTIKLNFTPIFLTHLSPTFNRLQKCALEVILELDKKLIFH